MPQPGVGRADFLSLGDWDANCSMCGRKRKASTLVRNWQGLYRCPEHNEPRQPQDFARGVPEDLQVPWAQSLANNQFVPFTPTIPVSVTPSPLILVLVSLPILDDPLGLGVLDENSLQIQAESTYIGYATILLPGWVVPVSYAWSWKSGGANITIDDPTSIQTYFQSITSGNSGVAKCIVTDSLGGVGSVTLSVSN